MIECSICNKGMEEGVSLFRLGLMGDRNAEWRCRVHMTFDQKSTLDPEVDRIVSIIEEDSYEKEF